MVNNFNFLLRCYEKPNLKYCYQDYEQNSIQRIIHYNEKELIIHTTIYIWHIGRKSKQNAFNKSHGTLQKDILKLFQTPREEIKGYVGLQTTSFHFSYCACKCLIPMDTCNTLENHCTRTV